MLLIEKDYHQNSLSDAFLAAFDSPDYASLPHCTILLSHRFAYCLVPDTQGPVVILFRITSCSSFVRSHLLPLSSYVLRIFHTSSTLTPGKQTQAMNDIVAYQQFSAFH